MKIQNVLGSLCLSLILVAGYYGPGGIVAADVQQRIQEKVREVQTKFPKWVESGGDPSRLETLRKDVDDYMKTGRLEDVEDTLDKILAIMEGRTPSDSRPNPAPSPPSTSTASKPTDKTLSPERKIRVGRIPESAEIVYSVRNNIYVMDANGANVTQITFDGNRHLEHVAVSTDRRYIVTNYTAHASHGDFSSRLLLIDLQRATERDLLPEFEMAGNGGVDWDQDGFIYFAGIDSYPYSKPGSRSEFVANFASNDVWKVRYDGTGLTRLTNTSERGEADVSVSEDGTLITYMDTYINPPNDFTEIWVRDSDGSNPRLVYKGGKAKVKSVHDPELSPDNRRIVFSQVNPNYKNFPDDPNANIAHDIYSIRLDGTGLKRMTAPGPISIIPDWQDSKLLYLLLTDRESPPFFGIVVMASDGSWSKRIKGDANIAKWIPPRVR